RVEAYEGQPEVPLKRLEGISEGLTQEPEVGDLPPLIDEDERVRHPLEEVGVEVPHLIHDRRTPQVAPLKELSDLRMAVAGGAQELLLRLPVPDEAVPHEVLIDEVADPVGERLIDRPGLAQAPLAGRLDGLLALGKKPLNHGRRPAGG